LVPRRYRACGNKSIEALAAASVNYIIDLRYPQSGTGLLSLVLLTTLSYQDRLRRLLDVL
jgi:hypothetical protein